MEDYQKEISKILGSQASSLKHTGTCQTCKDKPGRDRVDCGLDAGIHCDECWEELVSECRKKSW